MLRVLAIICGDPAMAGRHGRDEAGGGVVERDLDDVGYVVAGGCPLQVPFHQCLRLSSAFAVPGNVCARRWSPGGGTA
jgi:hypothetical protein